MKISKLAFLYVLLISVFAITACDDDDPVIENEEEVITTLTFVLTPDGGGDVQTFNFVDLDGDGGTDPVITNATLSANTTYSGSLTLLNESETPAEDITAEIEEDDDEHQFFFSSSIADLSVMATDTDGNGDPVGLSSQLTTGAAGTGTLTITLIHEPDKGATGVADGDITNAGGETDIEVTFDVTVQ